MRKNKKILIVSVFVLVLMFSFSLILNVVLNVASYRSVWNGITIVLDAGHGGRDGGSVGCSGTIESDLNLEYVKILQKKLQSRNYKIVLTRETDSGLYSPFASNKKVDDMNRRMEIIKKSNPNLVVSIHMNSFRDSSASGAVTYHRMDDIASEQCGTMIQRSLKEFVGAKVSDSKVGDYFMLNCSYYTSVLIECGFLSNPEEEKLLNSSEYKDKITEAAESRG